LKWFFAIPFILIGAFLYSLTIDDMGNIGHIMMKVIGFGCFFIAGYIARGKKEN